MTEFLATVGEVLTSGMSWVGTVATTVAANPVMLVPIVLGIAGVSISLFSRLTHL